MPPPTVELAEIPEEGGNDEAFVRNSIYGVQRSRAVRRGPGSILSQPVPYITSPPGSILRSPGGSGGGYTPRVNMMAPNGRSRMEPGQTHDFEGYKIEVATGAGRQNGPPQIIRAPGGLYIDGSDEVNPNSIPLAS